MNEILPAKGSRRKGQIRPPDFPFPTDVFEHIAPVLQRILLDLWLSQLKPPIAGAPQEETSAKEAANDRGSRI